MFDQKPSIKDVSERDNEPVLNYKAPTTLSAMFVALFFLCLLYGFFSS